MCSFYSFQYKILETDRPCQLIRKINEMANSAILNVSDKGAVYKIVFKLSLGSLVQIPCHAVNSPRFFFNYMRHNRCLVVVLNIILVAISFGCREQELSMLAAPKFKTNGIVTCPAFSVVWQWLSVARVGK